MAQLCELFCASIARGVGEAQRDECRCEPACCNTFAMIVAILATQAVLRCLLSEWDFITRKPYRA
jgi:hypothetical protein